MLARTKRPDRHTLLCSKKKQVEDYWFSSHYWQSKGLVEKTYYGRSTCWVVNHGHESWVLKHYYRGGAVAKISTDRYLFMGFAATRSLKEFNLLSKLHAWGLPVPYPIAARIKRRGLCYQADLITQHIPDAKPLAKYLADALLPLNAWKQLGQTLYSFHKKGVFHADLNAKNILIQGEKFFLIDFDQSCVKAPHASWQKANLKRLHRSLLKFKKRYPHLNFNHSCWMALQEGYQARENASPLHLYNQRVHRPKSRYAKSYSVQG